MHALAQPDLFRARLGRRPYSTDNVDRGIYLTPRNRAIRRRYIQANPPHLRAYMLFDVDREGGALAWEDAELPMVTWAAKNRHNSKAHLSYGLDCPVLLGDYSGREEPLRYLAALERALRVKLGADPGYAGLITKNPLSAYWDTFWSPGPLFTLQELHEYIGDLRKYQPRPDARPEGLGRNVETFHALRLDAASPLIRDYWGAAGGFVHYQAALHSWALDYTGNEHRPALDRREVHHISKSVARWTWAHFKPAGDGSWQHRRFITRQADKGRKSGQSRRAETAERDALILRAVLAGKSYRQVAREFGLTVGGVHYIVNRPRSS